MGLVLLALIAAATVCAILTDLLPDHLQGFAGAVSTGVCAGVAGAAYRKRVRSGKAAQPYPPVDRTPDARPADHRPSGEPIDAYVATQLGGAANSRGGHLRVYPEQLRFDPYLAGPTSARSWVARRGEVAAISATPRKQPIRVPWAKPLLTVTLDNGSVADFSVRRVGEHVEQLHAWLAGSR